MLALPLSALVVGLAYFYRSVFPYHEWLLLPAGAACLAAAGWYGVRRSAAITPLARLKPAALWLVAMATVMVLPVGASWIWLQWEIHSLPIPRDAKSMRTETNPQRWQAVSDSPRFTVAYATRMSFEEMDGFLRRRFTDRGWRFGNSYTTVASRRGFPGVMASWLRRRPRDGPFRGYVVTRADDILFFSVFDAGDERWFLASTGCEEPPTALSELLDGF